MLLVDARKLADELIAKHLPERGWYFEFDLARRRFGCTHYGTKQITLSKVLTKLNDEERVRNTILHEIAHVLAGKGNGHNYKWTSKALEIGCDGKRCYDSSMVVTVEPHYEGTCPNCGRKVKRYRRTAIACGRCCNALNHGRYSAEYKLTWARV